MGDREDYVADAVSSAQKLKDQTKLALKEAKAVLAVSATDLFSPQSLHKKLREVRLSLIRAQLKVEFQKAKMLERAQAEYEASKENLQCAELRDAQKKLAADRAADESIMCADTSQAGRAVARADCKAVFLMPSCPDSNRDKKSNKSPPTLLSKRSRMLDAANQKSKNTGSNVIAAAERQFPSQTVIVPAIVIVSLVLLMLATDKHVSEDMPNLLAVCLSGVSDSIVIFFAQLGDHMTHKTVSATNATLVALHNASFATKILG